MPQRLMLCDMQLETIKAKPGVLAIIDELEKITPLLKEVQRIAD